MAERNCKKHLEEKSCGKQQGWGGTMMAQEPISAQLQPFPGERAEKKDGEEGDHRGGERLKQRVICVGVIPILGFWIAAGLWAALHWFPN